MRPISEVLATGNGTAARCIMPSCGGEVWTADREGNIILRNNTGKETGRWRCKDAVVWGMAAARGMVWCGMSDGCIQIFQGGDTAKRGHVHEILPPACISYTSGALSLATHGNNIYVGYGNAALVLYDTQTYKAASINKSIISAIRAVTASFDKVFVGTNDSTLLVLDAISLRKIASWKVSSSSIQAVAISSAGHVWCGTSEGEVRIYSEKGKILHKKAAPDTAHPHGRAVSQILHVQDTAWVTSYDGRVEVYEEQSPYSSLDAVVPSPGGAPKYRPRSGALLKADECPGAVLSACKVSTRLQVDVWLSSSDHSLHRVCYEKDFSLSSLHDLQSLHDTIGRVTAAHMASEVASLSEINALKERLAIVENELKQKQRSARVTECERDRLHDAVVEALVLLGGCDELATIPPLQALGEVQRAGAFLKDYVTDVTAERNELRMEVAHVKAQLNNVRDMLDRKTSLSDDLRRQVANVTAASQEMRMQIAHDKQRSYRNAMSVMLQALSAALYRRGYDKLVAFRNARRLTRNVLRGLKSRADVALLARGYSSLKGYKYVVLSNRAKQLMRSLPAEKEILALTYRVESRHGTPDVAQLSPNGSFYEARSQSYMDSPHHSLLPSISDTYRGVGDVSDARLKSAMVMKLAAVVLSTTQSYTLCRAWCHLRRSAVSRKKNRREASLVTLALRGVTAACTSRYFSKLTRYPRMKQRQRARRTSAWKLSQYTTEEKRRILFSDWKKWSAASVTEKGSKKLEGRRTFMVDAMWKHICLRTTSAYYNRWLRYQMRCVQQKTLRSLHEDVVKIQHLKKEEEYDPSQVRGFIITTREQMLTKLFEQFTVFHKTLSPRQQADEVCWENIFRPFCICGK